MHPIRTWSEIAASPNPDIGRFLELRRDQLMGDDCGLADTEVQDGQGAARSTVAGRAGHHSGSSSLTAARGWCPTPTPVSRSFRSSMDGGRRARWRGWRGCGYMICCILRRPSWSTQASICSPSGRCLGTHRTNRPNVTPISPTTRCSLRSKPAPPSTLSLRLPNPHTPHPLTSGGGVEFLLFF